jgi:hypothetical protein
MLPLKPLEHFQHRPRRSAVAARCAVPAPPANGGAGSPLFRGGSGFLRGCEQIPAACRLGEDALQVLSQQVAAVDQALRRQMRQLQVMERAVADAPDHQVSLTDPDARAMATNGKGTGMVGYNVQTVVDAKHHLIIAHEVTNVGHDKHQLANIARQAKEVTPADEREGAETQDDPPAQSHAQPSAAESARGNSSHAN